jgi:competence protein ComEA
LTSSGQFAARCALAAVAALGALALTSRAPEAARAGQDTDSKSAGVFTAVCGKCHPIERITAARRTRAQWEEAITTMITARGAQVSDEEFDTVLEYLVKTHGRVAINRAPAADIVEVLEIPETQAAAIVAYRKEHGPFADFEALAKVPGLDRAHLDTKRDALSF